MTTQSESVPKTTCYCCGASCDNASVGYLKDCVTVCASCNIEGYEALYKLGIVTSNKPLLDTVNSKAWSLSWEEKILDPIKKQKQLSKQSTCYCCGIVCEDAANITGYSNTCINICAGCHKEVSLEAQMAGDNNLDTKDSKAWSLKVWEKPLNVVKDRIVKNNNKASCYCCNELTDQHSTAIDYANICNSCDEKLVTLHKKPNDYMLHKEGGDAWILSRWKPELETFKELLKNKPMSIATPEATYNNPNPKVEESVLIACACCGTDCIRRDNNTSSVCRDCSIKVLLREEPFYVTKDDIIELIYRSSNTNGMGFGKFRPTLTIAIEKIKEEYNDTSSLKVACLVCGTSTYNWNKDYPKEHYINICKNCDQSGMDNGRRSFDLNWIVNKKLKLIEERNKKSMHVIDKTTLKVGDKISITITDPDLTVHQREAVVFSVVSGTVEAILDKSYSDRGYYSYDINSPGKQKDAAEVFGYVCGTKLIWNINFSNTVVQSINGNTTSNKTIEAVDPNKLSIGDKVELEINFKELNGDGVDDKVTGTAFVVGFNGTQPFFAIEGAAVKTKNGDNHCSITRDYAIPESHSNRLQVKSDTARNLWPYNGFSTTVTKLLETAPPIVDIKNVNVGDRIEVEYKPGYCGPAVVIEKPSDTEMVYAYEKAPNGKSLSWPTSEQYKLYTKYGLGIDYTRRTSDSQTKIYTNYGAAPTFLNHKELAVGDMIDFFIYHDGKHIPSKGVVAYIHGDTIHVLCKEKIQDVTSSVYGVFNSTAQKMGWDSKDCGVAILDSSNRITTKLSSHDIAIIPFNTCAVGDLIDIEVFRDGTSFRAEALVAWVSDHTIHVVLKDKRDSASDCNSAMTTIADKFGYNSKSTALTYLNYENAVIHKNLGKATIKQVNRLDPKLTVGTRVDVCVNSANPVKAVIIQEADDSPYGEPIVAFESPNNTGWVLDATQAKVAARYGINRTGGIGQRIDGSNAVITKINGFKGLDMSNLQNGDRIKLCVNASYKDISTPICKEATVISIDSTYLTLCLDEVYRDTFGNLNNSNFANTTQKTAAAAVGIELADNDARVLMISKNSEIIIEEVLNRDLIELPTISDQPNIQSLQAGDRLYIKINDPDVNNGKDTFRYATVMGTKHTDSGLMFLSLDYELDAALILDSESNIKACETFGLKTKGKTGWVLNPSTTKIFVFEGKHVIDPSNLQIGDRVQVDVESYDEDDNITILSKEAIYLGAEDGYDNVFYFPNAIDNDSLDLWKPEINSLSQLAMERLGIWDTKAIDSNNAKCLYDFEGLSVRKILAKSTVVIDKEELEQEVLDLQEEAEDEEGDCDCSDCIPEVYGDCYNCSAEICIVKAAQDYDPDSDLALCKECITKNFDQLVSAIGEDRLYDKSEYLFSDDCWEDKKHKEAIIKLFETLDLSDIYGECCNCSEEVCIPKQSEDSEWEDYKPDADFAVCASCIELNYDVLSEKLDLEMHPKDDIVDDYWGTEEAKRRLIKWVAGDYEDVDHATSVNIKQVTKDGTKLKAGDRIEVRIASSEDSTYHITSTAIVLEPNYYKESVIALEKDILKEYSDLPADLEMCKIKDYSPISEYHKIANKLKINTEYYVWSIDELTDITAVLSGNYATNKGNKTMPYDNDGNELTFGQLIKSDAVNAGYRVAANQMTKGVKAALLMAMKDKGIEGGKIQALSEMLDTELGGALVSGFLGYGLTCMPGLGEDDRVKKLSREFRVNGMATAGNLAVDNVLSLILPSITDVMKTLPALPEAPVVKKPAKKKVPKDGGGIVVDHSSHN